MDVSEQDGSSADKPGPVSDAAKADDLMPRMARTDPSEQLVARRREQAARDELDRGQWEKTIEAHVAAHRLALNFLDEMHQWVADHYDFDLVADSRPAATWQMAGRSIGIARLLCHALSLGYTAEVLHLARALHEADHLASIFVLDEGTELLRKWLADEGDEWVRPGEVRAAEEKFEERLAEAMRREGLSEIRRTRKLTRGAYGDQSQAAHHRRKWTQDAVSPALRTMLRGPTTVWERRAVTTAAVLPVVEESVISVGGALDAFLPPDWFTKSVKPFLDSFEALRTSEPLP